MIFKLGMQHQGLKLYKVIIHVNDEPGLTLTYFTATDLDTTEKAILNEPRSEKTGLRGFRLGPTQTGQYNHRI